MKLRDLMTRNPESVSPNDHLADIAEKMLKLNVGALPVVENGHVLGVITDRDIVVRAISKHKSPEKEKVSKHMSSVVQCCTEDDDVQKAIDMMQKFQIRRVPIVNQNQKLVGMVTLGDLSSKVPEMCGEILKQVSQSRPTAAAA